jgi:hypothetical protein
MMNQAVALVFPGVAVPPAPAVFGQPVLTALAGQRGVGLPQHK